jgi:hypothetical protein
MATVYESSRLVIVPPNYAVARTSVHPERSVVQTQLRGRRSRRRTAHRSFTGEGALDLINSYESRLKEIGTLIRGNPDDAVG